MSYLFSGIRMKSQRTDDDEKWGAWSVQQPTEVKDYRMEHYETR